MLYEERKEEVVAICQKLIRSKSYSGEEAEVVDTIKEVFASLGYDSYEVDSYGNVIGCIKGKRPGKKILFDGHIDTVPVPDPSKWSKDPFGAEVIDGKVYGRGASDMKGQVSAMIAAAAYFAQDCQKDFAGEIYVAGVVHEEIFEGVAARKISENVQPDYVIIGESSEGNLKIGQRGRGEIVVETFGVPAHSANPEKGVNAVLKMASLLNKLAFVETPVHDVLGKGILVCTDIISSPYPGASVVPEYCKATFDRRLLVGETKSSVLAPIQQIIDEAMKEDTALKATVRFAYGKEKCYTGNYIEGERFFPGWLYEEQDTFVQLAYEGLKKAGLTPTLSQYSFCTNGSHYAGEAGIKTIGFGPSRENLAHTIDEYIEVEALHTGVRGYYGILQSVYNQ